MLDLLPLIGPLPIPLVAVAVLSGAETALFSLTYHDRLKLAREHPRAARSISYLLARPRGLLVLVLFLNMLAATIYSVLTSLAALRATEPWIGVLLFLLNLLAMTLVGEVVSKMLAARYREPISRLIAGPLVLVYRALRPVVEFVEAGIIAPLARLFVPTRARSELTGEELDALLHLGQQEGAIDANEQRVLAQVIALSNLRVRDVMTPRVDVQWLDATASAAEVQALAREHALTRIPVWQGDEEILGLLDVKKFLASHAAAALAPARATPLSIQACIEPTAYTPESASLDKLLHHLRTSGAKLSICVNEHGGVTGVVSLQDIVRRLITEISRQDEQDTAAQQVRLVGLGMWEVPGRLSVREWAGMFGLKPDRRVSTVAGLIFARLGRTPQIDDAITIGNVRLRVAALDGRVVETATVSLVDGATSVPTPGGAA